MILARNRRLFAVLGFGLFVSYAYFYQGGGWNQNSRFALVRAIIEQHTLSIDAYRDHTGDRAVSGGHYYSDKAPGASLLAVVPVDLARAGMRLAGKNPTSDRGIAWASYVATVATSGLFTVAAALAILWLSLSWGSSPGAGLFAATGYALSSPAWGYATLFMGHALAAGCLMIAFAAAVGVAHTSGVRVRYLGWTLGLFAGWAVVSDFPSAVPLVFILGLAVSNIRTVDPSERRGFMTRVIAGGAAAAFVLSAYNWAAFGSPFHLGYASEEGFEQLQTGLFGITYPRWERAEELLIGSYRGLLPISPLVALAPFGLAALARTPNAARAAWVAAAIAVFYLALNASYVYWDGGWIFGPRHMAPALPFLALGLAPLWDRCAAAGRAVLAGAWIWGAALALVAVATTPQPPAAFKHPVSELLVPAFLNGELALNTQRFTDFQPAPHALGDDAGPRASWNLGMKLNLTGHMSLLPLALVWAACADALAVKKKDDR